MQVLVYSGADSVSHSVRPNQKVGRSWKFQVAPAPEAVGLGPRVRRQGDGVRHVVAGPAHAGLELDGRLVVADVLVAGVVVGVDAQRRATLAQRFVVAAARCAGDAR